MARVFLSYDRDDAAKARTLAEALESAGHAVWWDSHIKGGTEYSREIEQALNDAQAVVVLWSGDAVNSPWVRDEAASGRDRGRLVPVLLDETNPPIGFRQYQNIDLSAWKGRGKPGGLEEIEACIDRLSGEEHEPTATAQPAARPRRNLSPNNRLSLIAAVALMVVAAAYFLVNRGGSSSAPVVAVIAADNSPSTRSLAGDLFIKLGSLQSTNADALQLVEGSDADPDLSFKVNQRAVDGQAQATVALLADDGSLLWSREFDQARRPVADLQQQIAYSSALVLKCATEAMAPGHEKLEQATLKLYLGGCAGMSEGLERDFDPLVEAFRKVTEQAPDFQGGWARLLITETYAWLLSDKPPALGRELKAHIAKARKLNPTMAEAYVAEAWMQELRQINRWMPLSAAAVEKNPTNIFALTEHANDMFQVGRLQQGVTYARKAAQLDPLSPWVRDSLITALFNAGELEAAKNALTDAERLWPGASNIVQLRFYLLADYDNPREALAMLRSGKVSRQYLSPATESFIEARVDPSPAKIERAIEEARAVSKSWFGDYIDTLAEFGRKEELITALSEFDPGVTVGPASVFRSKFAFVRNDVRFMAIMKKWGGQFDYWRKSGNWPDFCFEPSLPYDCKVEAAKLARAPS
ncbi:TIR domain-containing protein [Sphingomonas sp. NSE70-1]|uniref:TIR domain-containing protein n=1 Tax=Sphingomonas caseinilyticus TaxID=2908205 RepID=A0ABT0RSH3_9SPHN|nr:TIR domain-containing protein [Sphingomonas caseinilyticus]